MAKPYDELTQEEAEAELREYVASLPARLEWLRREVADSGGPMDQLDLEPGSLVPLWTWFVTQDHDVDVPADLADSPPWHRRDEGYCRRFGPRMVRMTDGLVAYLAGVAQRDLPGTTWAVGRAPKRANYVHQNKPVLRFPGGAEMNPAHSITTMVKGAVIDRNEQRRAPERILVLYGTFAEPARAAGGAP